ncbi:MAG TPA: acyl carrier protein [Solirubrobacteraceae bacterium]|jgi:acyl carrier protein|nr:acyl carrier protein [Solirubrobacteraceae bacterium]
MAQPAEQIRDFLVEEAHWEGPRAELTDDLALIDNQVIDSMLLLRLVAWLESEYQIAIDDTDVVPSNFGSIERIVQLVASKQA